METGRGVETPWPRAESRLWRAGKWTCESHTGWKAPVAMSLGSRLLTQGDVSCSLHPASTPLKASVLAELLESKGKRTLVTAKAGELPALEKMYEVSCFTSQHGKKKKVGGLVTWIHFFLGTKA